MKPCSKCGQVKDSGEFYPDLTKKSGLSSYCRVCSKARCVDRYKNNKETHDTKCRIYRASHKTEMALMYTKYAAKHKEKIKAYQKEYVLANKPAIKAHKTAYTARRRAQQRIATPLWADEAKIAEFYKLAKELSVNGAEYEVDHIVPLLSKLVCGLHVEFNLAIVPASYNYAKRNRYWPHKYDSDRDSLVSQLAEWVYTPQPNVLT